MIANGLSRTIFASGLATNIPDYLTTTPMETSQVSSSADQPSSYRLHLRNEVPGGQMLSNVPTLVLENLSSFLQNCTEAQQRQPSVSSHSIQPANHSSSPCASSSSNRPQIEWVHNHNGQVLGRPGDVLRMRARDLIQQERCEGNVAYSVDQPSRLVRIECLKPGCKCVLKQEAALALKIVCGVSLVRGNWSTMPAPIHHPTPPKWGSISSAFERLQHSRSSSNSSRCQTPHDQYSSSQSVEQIPLILTSCSPFWFEILKQQNDCLPGPSVPIWNSGKALWKARPTVFLLRKQTKCILSVSSSGGSRSPVTLDMDNVVNLHPGTVLRLLDCKTCRLVTKNHTQCPPSASLLQCEVVGSKSLAKYAAAANNLSPDDALYWFASGSRLVYLPLDDKSVVFSPVAEPPPNARENLYPNWATSGAHSVLSLLSHFPLPLVVRPVMEHSLANWLTSSSSSRDGSAGLQLTSCYHGDLVFLEPIVDCGPTMNATTGGGGGSSRFFVVTAEMLSQHRFILATPQSGQMYARELKTHASRVAHFLAAFHPAYGLNYLLKYLEDVTHCSAVGPSHRPLTETLGPLGGDGTIVSHTAVGSIAASMSLQLENEERCQSPDVHSLYDDLDDIYQYVRTGRYPAKARVGSNVNNNSGVLRSCSATPRQANLTPVPRLLRTKTRQDYTVPYLFFSPSPAVIDANTSQPPPPPRRNNLATPTPHAYEYPNPSRYLLNQQQKLLLCSSPSKRRQPYADCGRFRPLETPQLCAPPPHSYSILNFVAINERTNSSPDTGLGGDSGQSGSMVVPPAASTSIVRSSCHQLINFCESGVAESDQNSSHPQQQPALPLIYPNLRRMAVNVNKRMV